MKIYFTADSHFNHSFIAKQRGFNSVEDHDNYFINYWNSIVTQKDLVYFLGDFCFGGHEIVRKIRNKLKGKIVLILGNHDRTNRIQNITGVFTDINDIKIIKIDGILTVLSHYAMRVWPSSHYNSWQLYGHSHGGLEPIGKQWDVGLDNNNFKFLTEEDITCIMNKQPDNINLTTRIK